MTGVTGGAGRAGGLHTYSSDVESTWYGTRQRINAEVDESTGQITITRVSQNIFQRIRGTYTSTSETYTRSSMSYGSSENARALAGIGREELMRAEDKVLERIFNKCKDLTSLNKELSGLSKKVGDEVRIRSEETAMRASEAATPAITASAEQRFPRPPPGALTRGPAQRPASRSVAPPETPVPARLGPPPASTAPLTTSPDVLTERSSQIEARLGHLRNLPQRFTESPLIQEHVEALITGLTVLKSQISEPNIDATIFARLREADSAIYSFESIETPERTPSENPALPRDVAARAIENGLKRLSALDTLGIALDSRQPSDEVTHILDLITELRETQLPVNDATRPDGKNSITLWAERIQDVQQRLNAAQRAAAPASQPAASAPAVASAASAPAAASAAAAAPVAQAVVSPERPAVESPAPLVVSQEVRAAFAGLPATGQAAEETRIIPLIRQRTAGRTMSLEDLSIAVSNYLQNAARNAELAQMGERPPLQRSPSFEELRQLFSPSSESAIVRATAVTPPPIDLEAFLTTFERAHDLTELDTSSLTQKLDTSLWALRRSVAALGLGDEIPVPTNMANVPLGEFNNMIRRIRNMDTSSMTPERKKTFTEFLVWADTVFAVSNLIMERINGREQSIALLRRQVENSIPSSTLPAARQQMLSIFDAVAQRYQPPTLNENPAFSDLMQQSTIFDARRNELFETAQLLPRIGNDLDNYYYTRALISFAGLLRPEDQMINTLLTHTAIQDAEASTLRNESINVTYYLRAYQEDIQRANSALTAAYPAIDQLVQQGNTVRQRIEEGADSYSRAVEDRLTSLSRLQRKYGPGFSLPEIRIALERSRDGIQTLREAYLPLLINASAEDLAGYEKSFQEAVGRHLTTTDRHMQTILDAQTALETLEGNINERIARFENMTPPQRAHAFALRTALERAKSSIRAADLGDHPLQSLGTLIKEQTKALRQRFGQIINRSEITDVMQQLNQVARTPGGANSPEARQLKREFMQQTKGLVEAATRDMEQPAAIFGSHSLGNLDSTLALNAFNQVIQANQRNLSEFLTIPTTDADLDRLDAGNLAAQRNRALSAIRTGNDRLAPLQNAMEGAITAHEGFESTLSLARQRVGQLIDSHQFVQANRLQSEIDRVVSDHEHAITVTNRTSSHVTAPALVPRAAVELLEHHAQRLGSYLGRIQGVQNENREQTPIEQIRSIHENPILGRTADPMTNRASDLDVLRRDFSQPTVDIIEAAVEQIAEESRTLNDIREHLSDRQFQELRTQLSRETSNIQTLNERFVSSSLLGMRQRTVDINDRTSADDLQAWARQVPVETAAVPAFLRGLRITQTRDAVRQYNTQLQAANALVTALRGRNQNTAANSLQEQINAVEEKRRGYIAENRSLDYYATHLTEDQRRDPSLITLLNNAVREVTEAPLEEELSRSTGDQYRRVLNDLLTTVGTRTGEAVRHISETISAQRPEQANIEIARMESRLAAIREALQSTVFVVGAERQDIREVPLSQLTATQFQAYRNHIDGLIAEANRLTPRLTALKQTENNFQTQQKAINAQLTALRNPTPPQTPRHDLALILERVLDGQVAAYRRARTTELNNQANFNNFVTVAEGGTRRLEETLRQIKAEAQTATSLPQQMRNIERGIGVDTDTQDYRDLRTKYIAEQKARIRNQLVAIRNSASTIAPLIDQGARNLSSDYRTLRDIERSLQNLNGANFAPRGSAPKPLEQLTPNELDQYGAALDRLENQYNTTRDHIDRTMPPVARRTADDSMTPES